MTTKTTTNGNTTTTYEIKVGLSGSGATLWCVQSVTVNHETGRKRHWTERFTSPTEAANWIKWS